MQVRLFGFLIVFLCSTATLRAQFNRPVYDTVTTQGIRYKAELSGIASTSSRTPFWLRSNQFGTIPLESPAGIVSVGATGLWGDASQNRKPYFKASVEAVGNATRNSRFVLPEAYAAVRLGHGELYIGRRKEINGITDTLLTSGSYAWSGNAVPITQIRIGTKDYAPIKFTKGLFSINAFFSHGWFTNTDSLKNVYLHAKALYVKIGKPNWKIKFYGGMSHYVQWGGYSNYLGSNVSTNGKLPSNWNAYKKALWPNSISDQEQGYSEFDTANRSGNHLGSIDLATEISLKRSKLLLYVQRPWEDMSGIVFGNLPDGIYGLRWKKESIEHSNNFQLIQITAEYMTLMNQSGPKYPKGNDDYFNNLQYIDGWTHQQRIIGTPFMTRWMDADSKWKNLTGPFGRFSMINNNQVQVLSISSLSQIGFTMIRGTFSMSSNHGRPYSKEPEVHGVKQFSSEIEIINYFKRIPGLSSRFSIAIDVGKWLPTNTGIKIGIVKQGFLSKKI